MCFLPFTYLVGRENNTEPAILGSIISLRLHHEKKQTHVSRSYMMAHFTISLILTEKPSSQSFELPSIPTLCKEGTKAQKD